MKFYIKNSDYKSPRPLSQIVPYNFSGATITDLPPGVLYRVKATYKYVKEDMDELSFEVGDVICVIEYDDPDDQVLYYPSVCKIPVWSFTYQNLTRLQ